MKKSVVLVIVLIYLVSIVMVGFLGLKMRVYDEKIYVDKIVCLTDGYNEKITNEYDGYISKNYQKDLLINIICEVKPDNANQKKLEYIVDESKPDLYTITRNSDGTISILFHDATSVFVTVKSTDGKNVKLRIRIDVTDF